MVASEWSGGVVFGSLDLSLLPWAATRDLGFWKPDGYPAVVGLTGGFGAGVGFAMMLKDTTIADPSSKVSVSDLGPNSFVSD